MPRKKVPCPTCDQMMAATSQQCRRCKPTYERTAESRAKLSAALKGKPHNYRSGSTRPEVAESIRQAWTPEMREAARLRGLARNPNARYHGLSAKQAKQIVRSVGMCQRCGQTKGRLDIHHKDRNKHNQERLNLEVLCHRCHMREHARLKETGWDAYHARRRSRG